MSNIWYDSSLSTSSSSSDFYNKYYINETKKMVRTWENRPKFDFDDLLKVKKPEPPQTVFHFDPKGIVDKWPEDVS